MAQGIEIELKDIVLSNSSFGPKEIDYISRRISDDYTQFPILRDLTNELEDQHTPDSSHICSPGCLSVFAWSLQLSHRNSQQCGWRSIGALLSGQIKHSFEQLRRCTVLLRKSQTSWLRC